MERTNEYDVIIVGSGIAGLYCALMIPQEYRVAVLAKNELNTSNSALAQGGIAAAFGNDDSPKLHSEDTLKVGIGLNDAKSVDILTGNAKECINNLRNMGVLFDLNEFGGLDLALEGAHSKNRIVHVGDTTGAAVCKVLIAAAAERKNIQLINNTFVNELLMQDGACRGVVAQNTHGAKCGVYLCGAVVFATGGFGQIYENTTNSPIATGDGLAMAYRAGAELVDLEFVQYHPTVLYDGRDNNFLISEAVRGEGAILFNVRGERFMPQYHELAELAPRHVACRAIHREMAKTGSPYVLLDITSSGREFLVSRFPNIFEKVLKAGIDMSKQRVPIMPSQHYCIGGIKVDTYGRTTIRNLYACGETASNCVHGASRLASNSLLEGLVLGSRISQIIGNTMVHVEHEKRERNVYYNYVRTNNRQIAKESLCAFRKELNYTMDKYVGIVKNRDGLEHALERLIYLQDSLASGMSDSIEELELRNMLLVATLVIKSSLEREESRGAHFREDFPCLDDEKFSRHIIQKIMC